MRGNVMRKILPSFCLVLMPLIAAAQAQTPTTQPMASSLPAAGTRAPVVMMVDCISGQPLSWSHFAGTPVIVQFGSLSDPIFRKRQAMMEKLADFYGGRARFLLIYQREAHPAEDKLEANINDTMILQQPRTLEERLENARKAIVTLNLKNQMIYADNWANDTAKRYGGFPNSAFLIDQKGMIAASYPWTDPNKIRKALDEVLAGKPVSAGNHGPVRAADMPIANMDDMGGDQRGLGAAIRILDRTDLTDTQRNRILPALAKFALATRNLREKKQEMDQATLLREARNTAQFLQKTFKETLPPDMYEEIMAAINSGPIARLFDAR